jgi:alcohol dehydrogenase
MRTRAAVLYEMEKPRPYAQSQPLHIEELELAGPGVGEVLVEIVAAGLCHSDLSVVDGSRPRVMPMVLGHEAAGIVREVGPGVRELKTGDHVIFSFVPVCGHCPACAGGRAALCENGARANVAGTLLSGRKCFCDAKSSPLHHHIGVSGFSQYTVAAQESLIRIDASLPLEKAALFGCAVMTGVGAVVNTARVEPGTGVAIFGLGGVGLSAVLGAGAAGAHPIIAVDLLPAKLELARKLGASHTLQAGSLDVVQAIRDLTHGGVHCALDSSANVAAVLQAYHSTRRGGLTVAIGLPHPTHTINIPAAMLVGEERTIKGSYMGSCVPQRDVPRFIGMYQAGLLPIDLLHSHTIALDDINPALDRLASGAAVRQIIRF